ncbi:TolC family protein [Nonlabens tegetincola]|uniref:TolC family protein n=1 Tax=Nonlabens tegetincola TaxID=323273 RepID=UPI000CF3702D|nr:TolC family protein [Nonlabens tegetincola]PQJ18961.1 transporter [Nonlabens tegetincola]
MNKSVLYIMAFMGLAFAKAYSQQTVPDTFSLQEAIDYGLENNYQAINAQREVAKALKQKWETTATGLPQINGSVDYTNQLKQPVTPLPGEVVGGQPGTFVPVVFAPKQSMNLTATLSQLIFDGSYLVALEASKTFLDYSKNADNKTKLEVRKGIINAYGGVLLAQENVAILTRNRDNLDSNLKETQEIFKNGLTEEESVEQLQITLSQIENQLANARRQADIAMDMLKLSLGIDLSEQISLTDDLESLTKQHLDPSITQSSLTLEENVDYQIALNFSEQRRLEWKLERAKSLPTVSGFVNYGTQTFDDEFVFFNSDQPWFQQSVAGVSIQVPIFSSFGRKAAQDRTKIAWEQALTDLERTEQELNLNYQTAVNNYQLAIDTYQTTKDNLSLAERIENKNSVKFKEGIATSFELRQAQTQLYSTQSEYLNSMYRVIQEKVNIETLLNTPKFK